jgi:hypothetical protein
MRNDPPRDSPFERVPVVFSAAEVRSLVEQPAKDAGITVGALQGNKFCLTQYLGGKVDLLIDVTMDSMESGFIERQLSVCTDSGEQLRHETVEPLLLLRLDASGCPIALIGKTWLTESELIREILRPITELATH